MNVYAIVTPFVLLLILAEIAWCLWKKNGYYELQDSIASLGTAIINQCVNVLVAFLWLPVLAWLYAHRVYTFTPGLGSAVVLFLGIDFLFYWFHRFGHRTNIGWAAHSPHHSTEELNYAVALRASVTQRFASFFFYWPMVLVGFDPQWLVSMVAFHLVLQLIPHTRVVPKLPRVIESWMNTPSHHRVHHARNERYLDKNYGGFLIIWDKLFGTFEPEGEEAEYGVTVPPNTWDPTFINFQFWRALFTDALKAPHKLDALRLWFMPTGWRPRGIAPYEKAPKGHKFRSTPLSGSTPYLIGAIAAAFPIMLAVTRPDSPLDAVQKVVLSGLLWLGATAWGGILESKRWAVPLEAARLVATAGFFAPLWQTSPLFIAASVVSVMTAAWSLLLLRARRATVAA